MIKFLNANLLTMCFLCLNLNTRAQPVYDFKDIDKIIMDSMDRHQFTSMSIGIIKGNKVAYTRGYGYANLKSKIPATDENQHPYNWPAARIAGRTAAACNTLHRVARPGD